MEGERSPREEVVMVMEKKSRLPVLASLAEICHKHAIFIS